MLYLPIRLRSAVSPEDEPLGTGSKRNTVMETPLIILRTDATRSTDSDSSLCSPTWPSLWTAFTVILPLSIRWFRIVVGINRWTDLEPRVAGNTPQNSTGVEVMNETFVRKLISGYIYKKQTEISSSSCKPHPYCKFQIHPDIFLPGVKHSWATVFLLKVMSSVHSVMQFLQLIV